MPLQTRKSHVETEQGLFNDVHLIPLGGSCLELNFANLRSLRAALEMRMYTEL